MIMFKCPICNTKIPKSWLYLSSCSKKYHCPNCRSEFEKSSNRGSLCIIITFLVGPILEKKLGICNDLFLCIVLYVVCFFIVFSLFAKITIIEKRK